MYWRISQYVPSIGNLTSPANTSTRHLYHRHVLRYRCHFRRVCFLPQRVAISGSLVNLLPERQTAGPLFQNRRPYLSRIDFNPSRTGSSVPHCLHVTNMTIPTDMMTEEWMDEFERNFASLRTNRNNEPTVASSFDTDTTDQDKSKTQTTPQSQPETDSCICS